MTSRQTVRLSATTFCLAALCSCQREMREFDPPAAAAQPVVFERLVPLQAGEFREDEPTAAEPPKDRPPREYEENAYATAEGKRLFSFFNCVGCHAHGGGGSGPPLIDSPWRYGHEPEDVFATIVRGRPNGMPSFGGKIPAYQVWQLVAYVRSLSGLTPKDAAPARNDDMYLKPPENSKDREKPTRELPPEEPV